MKKKKSSISPIPSLCSERGPEDGIDPRDLPRATAREKGGRKTHQLCAQVAEALQFALGGACNDDVLRDMGVVAVQPAPDESRLLVILAPTLSGPCDPDQVMAHVHAAKAKLKAEVAASVHRKKVPDLTFRVVPEFLG